MRCQIVIERGCFCAALYCSVRLAQCHDDLDENTLDVNMDNVFVDLIGNNAIAVALPELPELVRS